MTRILVTGSRKYFDKEYVRQVLRDEVGRMSPETLTLVHGDAPGLDWTAAMVARELGWNVEAHPADWSRGPKAGPERNQRMADAGAAVCLAFPQKGSKGTWDCMKRAFEAGIPVVVVTRP